MRQAAQSKRIGIGIAHHCSVRKYRLIHPLAVVSIDDCGVISATIPAGSIIQLHNGSAYRGLVGLVWGDQRVSAFSGDFNSSAELVEAGPECGF